MSEITKEQAYEILKNYEIKRLEHHLQNTEIVDTKPDWAAIYLTDKSSDNWYCIPPGDSLPHIGASRIVVISKSTGKVIFDGLCGE